MHRDASCAPQRRPLRLPTSQCSPRASRRSTVRTPEPEVRLARSPGSACDDASSSHRDDNRPAWDRAGAVDHGVGPQRYSTEVQQQPVATTSSCSHEQSRLAGPIANRPGPPVVRDEERATHAEQADRHPWPPRSWSCSASASIGRARRDEGVVLLRVRVTLPLESAAMLQAPRAFSVKSLSSNTPFPSL